MRSNLIKFKLLIGAVLFSVSVCAQQVYSWVDKNGVRHFSDVPTSQSAEVVEGIESTPTPKAKNKNENQSHGSEEEHEEYTPGAEVPIKGSGTILSCNKSISYHGNYYQGSSSYTMNKQYTTKKNAMNVLKTHENSKDRLKKENERLNAHLEKQQAHYNKNKSNSIKYAIENTMDQIAENNCEIQVHLRYMELTQEKINSL
ncbi:DUF4124 domain-containing protein [Pseudoalteromonas sp. NEC-BIFX-2020_015]|uniref:DUF4124 domain-containing protein n=1 Tax=Pseudoalteromonas sp. NEC-BIFX-2020_015 TaxID=2729544 RepID=UPI00146147DD|nr:DUF4124 domain-containing protein [Pseudoalteromonas sp. NEC-BIFX-2020_015]NMR23998.1 DUF4124 domain-containing protein [Pseudoalteromonas sp. NEC-BIFX-2020_015]